MSPKPKTLVQSFELPTQRDNDTPTVNGVMPYGVLRCGGVPSRTLDHIACRCTIQGIDNLLRLEQECLSTAAGLAADLGELIASGNNTILTRQLLALRRDVFNDRFPKTLSQSGIGASMMTALSKQVRENLDKWLELKCKREHGEQTLRRDFSREMSETTNHLRRAFHHNEFRQAIAFTNPTLSKELDKFIANRALIRTKQVRQTERTLLKYYLRAIFKLSPFSSFARSRLVYIGSQEPPKHYSARRRIIRRSITVNRAFVATLANLIESNPSLLDYIPIRPNLIRIGTTTDQLMFLCKHYKILVPARMRIPEESLVVLSPRPFVETVDLILKENGCALPPSKLKSLLEQVVEDQGQGRIAKILNSLIQVGLFNHQISLGQEEHSGLTSLIQILQRFHTDTTTAIAKCLESLQVVASEIERARPDRRRRLVLTAETMAAQAFMHANMPEANWRGSILYEDSLEEPVSVVEKPNNWNRPILDLQRCLSIFGEILDGNASNRLTLKEILKTDFGGRPTPFLRLLYHFKNRCIDCNADQAPEFDHTPNWLNLPSLRHLGQYRSELAQIIAEPSDIEEVDIENRVDSYKWQRRLAQLGIWDTELTPMWFSCYVQFWDQTETGGKVLLNKVIDGPYRPVARVCGMMADDKTRGELIHNITDSLISAWSSAAPAEVRDSFDYNANLHPKLTPLSIEGNFCDHANSQRISWSDLVVQVDEADRLVVVTRETGRIIPLDLGMLDPIYAPLKQKLLISVSRAMLISPRPFYPLDWCHARQVQPVQSYPRLTFGVCVVRPRSWAVERSALPIKDKKMDDFEYFMALRRWQMSAGLPDEVFVSLAPSARNISQLRTTRRAWNLRTPIYINFASYSLVDILERVIREATTLVYFEELAPVYRRKFARSIRPTELVLDIAASAFRASGQRDMEARQGRRI